MSTTNTMNDGSEIRVPSGYEVESATFHVPATGEENVTFSDVSTGRSGFRGKLDDLKSRGLDAVSGKVHHLQHRLADRKTALSTSLATTKVSMRDGVTRQISNTQSSMKNSPMLWAGIAAGSGFALGLLGRYMHWRNDHRRMSTPDLVIIDATC
jgi:ElaB/YqjD/DUF883 family membrane-anchored ribosome-binding protein